MTAWPVVAAPCGYAHWATRQRWARRRGAEAGGRPCARAVPVLHCGGVVRERSRAAGRGRLPARGRHRRWQSESWRSPRSSMVGESNSCTSSGWCSATGRCGIPFASPFLVPGVGAIAACTSSERLTLGLAKCRGGAGRKAGTPLAA